VATEAAYDYLTVYDGPSSINRTLATISGSSGPTDLLSSGNALTLRFVSDSQTNGVGVRGIVWLISRLDMCNSSGATVALGSRQVLPVTTNAGPVYSNNVACTQTFTAPAGHTLVLTLTAVATEAGADVLLVYDGPSTSSSSLAPGVSGAVVNPVTASAQPWSVSTSGPALTLRFLSNNATIMGGVQAVVAALPQRNFCVDRSPLALGTMSKVNSTASQPFVVMVATVKMIASDASKLFSQSGNHRLSSVTTMDGLLLPTYPPSSAVTEGQ
jgi:hypothetical protein